MTNNIIINSIGIEHPLKFDELTSDNIENIFIFFRNIYDHKGNLTVSFLEILKQYYDANNQYIYKNVIIVPEEKNKLSALNDNVLYIIWFSKSEDSYFDKDSIREKHIWKNVEWGKREKNYSPKGKDPSNVWIPTLDDGKGKITSHVSLKIHGAVERLFKSFGRNNLNWLYYDFNKIEKMTKEQITKEIEEKSIKFLDTEVVESKSIIEKKSSIKQSSIIFDSSEKLSVPDKTIDLIVTSPPYWNLKDYFKNGQIGQESYDEYLERLESVWKECIRVIKKDGLIWININIRTNKKKPYFIPTDYINQMRASGMYLKDIVIWHKSSSIPTTNRNLSDKYEVFLIFSCSEDIYLNSKVIDTFNEYKNDFIKGGTLWNINRKAGSIGKKYVHPAIYPNMLVERVIKLCTNEKECILDPFLGSGTSGIVALNNQRNFIGIEYNEGFLELIKYRMFKETKINEDDLISINNKDLIILNSINKD